MCSGAIASKEEPSSGLFPLSYTSNVGTDMLSTDHKAGCGSQGERGCIGSGTGRVGEQSGGGGGSKLQMR
jgi:hypothetical protein